MMVNAFKHVKIPQRFFNPLLVKNECRKELNRSMKKNFYTWKDMMFRNGFLYHKFGISKLTHENVCPNLHEVKRFQVDPLTLEDQAGGGFDSDQDEWDLLKDETLLQTIVNDTKL
jgi:hypothetical protein